MLDEGLHSLLELTVGVSIPLKIDPATIVLDTPIPGREDWSFPAWVMRQPVKCGGMGLRSYVETCGPAFIGAIEIAIPTLHTGFGSILTNEVGGADMFGEGVQAEGRWRTLLNSGCRVGRELSAAWNTLKEETMKAMTFLGLENDEINGPISSPVESAGGGSTNGGTRGLLVAAREMLMGKVLVRSLELHNDQKHRAVWSWPERDKMSAQWLLCLPGHNSTLTSSEFTESISSLLCLPSPACSDPKKLGEKIGRKRIDKYGDTVISEPVAGDGFRRRHDEIKGKLLSLLKWSGIDVECEVFNLFSGLIPQEGLNRLERGRKRQGILPDFRIRSSVPGDGVGSGGAAVSESRLAELKVLSSCPTRYARAPRSKRLSNDGQINYQLSI